MMAQSPKQFWENRLRLSSLRWLILFALVAYPAGAIIQLLSEAKWLDLAGLLLIVAALFCCIPVLSSRLYKIAGEGGSELDEFEARMRLEAVTSAYYIFISLVVSGVIYLAIAADGKGLWMPSIYEHYNAIFWGVVLYAMMLPVAVLGFRMKDSDPDGEA